MLTSEEDIWKNELNMFLEKYNIWYKKRVDEFTKVLNTMIKSLEVKRNLRRKK